MYVYSTLVFIHVLGGVGVYVALGIEAVALGRFQRAVTPAEAGTWLRVLAIPGRLVGAAMLLALGSGIWMMVLAWGQRPWALAAFVAMVAMGIAGGGVTGRAMRRLGAALQAEGGASLSGAFHAAAASAALTASFRLRIALGLGILGLMTLKPEAGGAAAILAAAAVGGLVACVPLAAGRSRLAGA